MTDLDQFRAELAGGLAGLSPSQRLKAAREMADPAGRGAGGHRARRDRRERHRDRTVEF
jgi:hypothetical protein